MTVLVTGSRDWTDRRRIVKRLLDLPDDTTIIHGNAIGADKIAHHAAEALGLKIIPVPVSAEEWGRYGRAAGPIRNRRMLDMKPDRVIAFLKNQSRGTSDCIAAAIERGIPIEVIDATS